MKVCIEAVSAGLCAALASVFAKLAMASHNVPDLCHSFLQATLHSHSHSVEDSMGQMVKMEDFCASVSEIKFL